MAIPARLPAINDPRGPAPSHGGDGGGTIPPMETRVTRLEESMQQLQTDVAVIKSNYVTREDLQREIGSLRSELHSEIGGLRGELHRAINEQTWKVITWTTGLGGALVGATYLIARNVHP